MTTKSHSIAVIGGDGIGPEVVAEALKVVRAAGVDLDTQRLRPRRRPLPARRRGPPRRDGRRAARLRRHPARRRRHPRRAARGHRARPAAQDALRPRPVHQPAAVPPPAERLDFIVIRENTEGTYAGEGGFLRKGTPHEIATQGSVNTRMGVERCVRYAFELARSRARKHLTLVHKTNVLTFAGDLWQRTFDEVPPSTPTSPPPTTTSTPRASTSCRTRSATT